MVARHLRIYRRRPSSAVARHAADPANRGITTVAAAAVIKQPDGMESALEAATPVQLDHLVFKGDGLQLWFITVHFSVGLDLSWFDFSGRASILEDFDNLKRQFSRQG